MRYELLLQAPKGETFDEAAATLALAARHPVTEATPRLWRLPKGSIEVHVHRMAAEVVALEVHVPLSENDELLRDTLKEASAAAQAVGLVLYDPQLNRPVTATDEMAIAEQFRRNALYVGEMTGAPGITGIGVSPDRARVTSGAKVLLAILAFLVLALALSDVLSKLLIQRR